MTEKTAPWWRSFAGKRRKAARESAAMLEQDLAAHANLATATSNTTSTTTSTTNTTTKEKPTEPERQNLQPFQPPRPQGDGLPSLPSDETYDDSAVQPTFGDGASRRNLRVSRSGRFKEKRHNRVSLPSNYQDSPNPDAKPGAQAQR
ncbi:proline-rich protein 15 [Astyanax mexicanus]|uniref:proline-rich protein 15 n=1 Tax=Astyanax mexicanus TaxID=7994 RepID=UPI0020CAF780|nr:proline-rich protein 15 [Astyanax mexicanus]